MTRSADTLAVRILLYLYLVEAALLLILVGIYKAPVYDWTLLSTKAGIVLIVGGLGLIASGWLLVRQNKTSALLRGRAFALGLTTNLLTGLIAFLVLETTIRIAARRTHAGIVVGSVAVRATWPELATESREVLARIAPSGNWDASYFVYDRELGWTVGPNRRTPDGMYFSSVEGIRTPGPNMRMADQISRCRVALIGDSHAFSFEVPFEDSWGANLQLLLGDGVQVLNFGVDGYGIDQTYLRYLRDVRSWKPTVVVIGFGGHDLWRTMAVYPGVSFGWTDYLAKPRFAIEDGELKLLNVPLPTPDELLRTAQVHQLPFVEYDLGYGTTDWSWQFDHAPLVVRFLTSAFPRSTAADSRVSEEATKALNSRLLTQLVDSIRQAGSVPLVVFMSARNSLVPETLARAHVPFLDATECLTEVPDDRRKVPSGHHYTGLANRAIARCTAPAVELALRSVGNPARRPMSLSPGSEGVSTLGSNAGSGAPR